ncbi:MAG: MFS transporter [Chitinivibrionales bacterium]|nr:MFS transporter [Chitinivibrionales bacterium]
MSKPSDDTASRNHRRQPLERSSGKGEERRGAAVSVASRPASPDSADDAHRTSPERPPGTTPLSVVIMSLVLLMGVLNTGMVGPNRMPVQREFGLTHSQFGIGLAVVQILATFALFASTRLIERLNPLMLLAASQLLQAVGLFGIFATNSIGMLVSGWALVAFGMRLNSISNSLSMALWPQEPRKGVTLLHGYNAVGKLIGPLLVAVCIGLGWRFSFAVVSAVCLLLFISLLLLVVGGRVTVPSLGSRPPGTGVFRRPLYWVGLSCIMLISGGEAVFATLFPSYLQQIDGYTTRMASVAFSVHLAGLTAGRFISAYGLRRLTNNRIIALCLASAAFLAPVLLFRQPLIRYPSLFLFGFLFSTTWPTFFAQLSARFPGEAGALSYGAGFASTLGISLSVLVSSFVADSSITAALLLSPLIMLAFGLVHYTSPLSRKTIDQSRILQAAE